MDPLPLNTRMDMIGRAATFVDTIDQKQTLVMAQLELETGRMDQRVMEINVLKVTIEAVAKETSAKFDEVIVDFKKFADDARLEISTGSVANKEAMAKAEEVRTCVSELFEKPRVTFYVHEKTLIELRTSFNAEVAGLRQGGHEWSTKYTEEVKQMVQLRHEPRPEACLQHCQARQKGTERLEDSGQ